MWIQRAFFYIEILSQYIPTKRPGYLWQSGVVLMTMALFLQACGPSPSATPEVQTGQLSVAATIYPVQFLAERIGGDRVQVRGLVPTGVESHSWEPSSRNLRDVYNADVFIHSGGGFEGWVDRLLRDLESDGPLVISAAVREVKLDAHHDDGEHQHEVHASAQAEQEVEESRIHQPQQEHGDEHKDDPHMWLDPALYALQAERVRDGLMQADPAGATIYDANLSSLQDELAALEAEMERGLANCERNSLVVSHAAYGHLTWRFGLEQIAIAGVSPEVEPSPAKVRAVTEQVRSTGATHVLYETLLSPRIAQTIAEEAEVELLPLNPLEGLTEEQASAGADYFTVMHDNLTTLRTALGCR